MALVESPRVVDDGRGCPKERLLPSSTTRSHEAPDDGSTHWTTRLMANRFGIGKDTVARIWRDHNLKPWKVDTFKVSNDPRFEEKLVDVVGLYLNPPERAVVFSFDEKTQVQALDRTQPSLPMKRGRGATLTHDYKRHGTTDLFAAMNRRHRRGALRYEEVPQGDRRPRLLQVHRPPRPEGPRRPRRARQPLGPQGTAGGQVVGRPEACTVASCTSHRPRSSWLNLIERWFNELTERRLRRGVFTSVPHLIDAIEIWTEHWNDDPKPFVWHKQAEEIIAKVRRGRASLTQVKSATRPLGMVTSRRISMNSPDGGRGEEPVDRSQSACDSGD